VIAYQDRNINPSEFGETSSGGVVELMPFSDSRLNPQLLRRLASFMILERANE